eukprot:CAMPEP_0170162414 /NCGR_PEP_ID=MMETSP0033_2-20121228/77081_1 /TAXON_ID=195969 /ORGANISM="Dolichomastix tenuilepis, Strain CCMP3274" /LENGTH=254 /DNA_ID=CAMNT_0010400039 /DNA_START=387 /DNA_END=1151 /DNA_ORIENTATION=+
MTVGMLRMPYSVAMPGDSSVLSFTALSLPAYSVDSSSMSGAIMRHGPHHGAQKSTSTGMGLFKTSASNVASVTADAVLVAVSPSARAETTRAVRRRGATDRSALADLARVTAPLCASSTLPTHCIKKKKTMQAIAQTPVLKPSLRRSGAKSLRSAAARPTLPARAVKCTASAEKKVQLAATTAASTLVASPAFALVDDRMGGDGTGLPLGVNDPVLAFVLVAMATLIWALYFFAGGADEGIINGGKDDDSGLSL